MRFFIKPPCYVAEVRLETETINGKYCFALRTLAHEYNIHIQVWLLMADKNIFYVVQWIHRILAIHLNLLLGIGRPDHRSVI